MELIGTTPILLHRISQHQLREEIASKRGGTMSLAEEAVECMSKDDTGAPVVPVAWIWDSIRRGCSRVLIGSQQVSFFKLQSEIKLPEGVIPLVDKENAIPIPETYSSMQHAAPGSKQAITVVAPLFRNWKLCFEAAVETEFPHDQLLAAIFLEAGKAGIGLFHPPKKHFGKFRSEIYSVAQRSVELRRVA